MVKIETMMDKRETMILVINIDEPLVGEEVPDEEELEGGYLHGVGYMELEREYHAEWIDDATNLDHSDEDGI